MVSYDFYFRKLFLQLEQFKQNINEKPESQTQGVEDAIVYQLKYRPEYAKLQQTTRISELEGRLHRLETVLGSSNDKLSRLTTVANKGKGTIVNTSKRLLYLSLNFRRFIRSCSVFECHS